MKITRDNYEIWFLDYLEERLDHEQEEMVRLFLLEHPDLKDELEAYSPNLKADSQLIFPDKESLKKAAFEDAAYLENSALAAMEGELPEEELLSFNRWLEEHPDQQISVQRLHKCKLQPDQRIVFPNKEELKKKKVLVTYFIRATAIAAILLLAFLVFDPTGERKTTTQMATTEPLVQPNSDRQVNSPSGKSSQVTSSAAEITTVKKRFVSATTPKVPNQKNVAELPAANRPMTTIRVLEPRSNVVAMELPMYSQLVPLTAVNPLTLANIEMPISDFLKGRVQELKANDDHELLNRNKVFIAGLNLFSKLSGKNLTGKRGRDGRLRTISFNTQLLAVSIPVNREL